jgi:hypothetical protein
VNHKLLLDLGQTVIEDMVDDEGDGDASSSLEPETWSYWRDKALSKLFLPLSCKHLMIACAACANTLTSMWQRSGQRGKLKADRACAEEVVYGGKKDVLRLAKESKDETEDRYGQEEQHSCKWDG